MGTDNSGIVLQPVGNMVIVPLRGPVQKDLIAELRDGVLGYLHEHGARGVVVDMAGVDVLDLHDFEALRGFAEAATLMGAPVLFASILPGVAAGLTMLGAEDSWVCAARTVDHAIAMLK